MPKMAAVFGPFRRLQNLADFLEILPSTLLNTSRPVSCYARPAPLAGIAVTSELPDRHGAVKVPG